MLKVKNYCILQELCAVYREPLLEQSVSQSLQTLAIQNHIEGFVNACCYHMWSGLL